MTWRTEKRYKDWVKQVRHHRTKKTRDRSSKNLCLKRGFCGQTKEIPRRLMPQIYDPVAFAKRIRKDYKVASRRVCVPASKLHPSQNEIHKDRVQEIVDDLEAGKAQSTKPIVITKDMYILDGHHRWAAYKQWNPSVCIPALKLSLNAHDALGLAATLQKKRESF